MKQGTQQTAFKQKSNPKYKDSLFRVLFGQKERAIELCNAVAGTSYTKDTPVTICDTGNSLLKRYNDLAFAFDDQLIIMIEHQSTLNLNMPLRFLFYIPDILFMLFVDMSRIYGKKILKIPAPQFYVLYNGEETLKQETLRLSDTFKVSPTGPSMELMVKIVDVNHDSGSEILSKSGYLEGYAYLIASIRGLMETGLTRDAAIKGAIRKCIDEGILVDFLKENFEEVSNMLMWEYDQAAEYRIIREENWEE